MSSSDQRWFGTGQSRLDDPARAGAEAVRVALAGRRPALLVLFASMPYANQEMASAAHAAAGGDVPLIGCSTSGEYGPDGRGQGVLVVALGGPGFQVAVRAAPEDADLRAAGEAAAGGLTGITSPHRMLFLLSDGIRGDQQEAVRGAYRITGASVPLVGGCAGDGLRQVSTRQFVSTGRQVSVLSDTVVGAAVGSTGPLGVGLSHGWVKGGQPMVVTSSGGGKIFELDHERAVDVYLRRTGGDPALPADPAAFLGFATVNPLGLSRRTGEDMRVIVSADLADGSISGLTDTPEGALAWVMRSDREALIDAPAMAATDAIKALDGEPPIGVLVFDCCVRLLALDPAGCDASTARLSEQLGGVPMGGFYSNGEIARTAGTKGMHHLTVVALAAG